jgi:hypothetical protein
LQHAGYAYPYKVGDESDGEEFLVWPNSHHGPDDGSEDEEYVYDGKKIVAQAKLNRGEDEVEAEIEPKGESCFGRYFVLHE